ncbi:hypothetical protein D3C80_2046440 [compost metagenome]
MPRFGKHQEGARHFLGEEADRKSLEFRRIGDDRQDTARLALHTDPGFEFQVRCWHVLMLLLVVVRPKEQPSVRLHWRVMIVSALSLGSRLL